MIGEFLIIGFSNPVLIAFTPPTGPCVLWSSGEASRNVTGSATISTNIPPNPAFLGLELFFQGFALDATAPNPFLLEFTNGIRAVVAPI